MIEKRIKKFINVALLTGKQHFSGKEQKNDEFFRRFFPFFGNHNFSVGRNLLLF